MRLHRLIIMLWCWASFVVSLAESPTVSAAEINCDTALKLIHAKEREITSFRWECRIRGPDYPASGKLSKVALDSSGRFRMEALGIGPAYDPSNKALQHAGLNDIRSFDGHVYRQQTQQVPGDSLPSEKTPAFGYITNGQKGTQQESTQEGLQFFLPYFFPVNHSPSEGLVLLSEYLRNKIQSGLPVLVNESRDGLWEISTVSRKLALQPGKDRFTLYLHIVYAPAKGKAGAVLKVVESPNKDFAAALQHKTGSWQEISYDLQEINGYWVPRLVRFTTGYPGSRAIEPTEYAYSDVNINRPLTEEDFIIHWKKGAFITDDIAQQTYVATASPVDEHKAVEIYASAHNLRKPATLKEQPSRYVLWATSVLLILLICVFVLRQLRKRKGASLMLLGIVVGSALASPSLPCLA